MIGIVIFASRPLSFLFEINSNLPSCAFAILSAIDKPKPHPPSLPLASSRRSNGFKSLSSSLLGIPGPSSITLIVKDLL